MAPLIRFTLLTLYVALVMPLPCLAPLGWRGAMLLAALLGGLPILALLSERVEVTASGLSVGYPRWCSRLLRRGWSLPWTAIRALTPVATSQGGRVFYVRVHPEFAAAAPGLASAYLLPQRLERFEEFLQRFQHFTGIDTAAVVRLTPAWTYQLLAALALMLLLGEAIGIGLRSLA